MNSRSRSAAQILVALLLLGCTSSEPPQSAVPTSVASGVANASTSTTSLSGEAFRATISSLRDQLDLLRDLYAIPIDLPFLEPGEDCPVTAVGDAFPDVVAQTYGEGPVYATLGSWDGTIALNDTVIHEGWYIAKVLWSVDASYTGGVLIRGRQLDGGGALLFSPDEAAPTGRQLVQLYLGPATAPADQAARFGPGGIQFRHPGCYGVQVDGDEIHDVIVFRVVD